METPRTGLVAVVLLVLAQIPMAEGGLRRYLPPPRRFARMWANRLKVGKPGGNENDRTTNG